MLKLRPTLLLLPLAVPAAAQTPDFARDVRPVLSTYCFQCHGPDEEGRKGKLRLDIREAALAPAKSGERAIVPGKPDESELLKRIHSTDEDEVMPPPATKKEMTAADKDVLRRWIAGGAEYADHWAFTPPVRPAVPANGAENPVDAFVHDRLAKEKLAPSPPADAAALLRRVSLDLTGLPPSPEEVTAFVAACSDTPKTNAAYAAAVDRLLASPQYGERWARKWLDLARYADTNGYEKDRPRQIWPFRDWVVRSLNADMPFDQFTIAQLAGDLLPNASAEQIIATGFHRNTMLNEEGGIDPLEFRFHAMTDRMSTTGATWLGLTMQCCQCHTHKYDPIQHKEYYSMMAFLNNADEPDYDIRPPDAETELAARAKRRAELIAKLPDQWPAGEIAWQPVKIAAVNAKDGDQGKMLDDCSVLFASPGPAKSEAEFEFTAPQQGCSHLKLETLTDASLPSQGPGRTPHGNFVLSEITVTADGKPVKIAGAQASAQQKGFPVTHAFDGDFGNGWAVHEEGRELNQTQWAAFRLAAPVSGKVRVKLSAVHGGHHTPGRVKFSAGTTVSGQNARALADAAFEKWIAEQRPVTVPWSPAKPIAATSNLPKLTIQPDHSILGSGDISKSDTYDVTVSTPLTNITAVRLEALPHSSLPRGGPGMTYYEGPKGDFFMGEFQVTSGGQPVKVVRAVHSYAKNNFGGQADAMVAVDGDAQTGWSTAGGEGRAHEAVFVFDKPLTPQDGQVAVKMMFGRHYACSLGHFRISFTAAPDPKASAVDGDVRSLLTKAGALTDGERARLKEAFLLSAPELASARSEIEQLAQPPAWQTTLVMRERPSDNPRPTFIHHRGEYTQPKDRVEPAVPAFLPALPQSEKPDRLAFARWLVSRGHPLTARVVVNRQWAAFFGRGLVKTQEDFGYMGDLPSHPELLDWLAVEFMESGWSIKKMHRLIVMSETYRQSSRVQGAGAQRDAENILLWRGPRHRLEAEQIRDSALKAAGLLSLKMGGPGVYPPQPAGVTTEGTYGAMQWQPSSGEDRYRRSLYTFAKRTAPFAMGTTFDAPSGEACVARRDVSNTPLQSLTLLNDTMFMEAAQALAKTVATLPGSTQDKVRSVFLRIHCRPATDAEAALLVKFLTKQETRVKSGALNAAQLTGDAPDAARAAWVLLIRALMNTDEFVGKA